MGQENGDLYCQAWGNCMEQRETIAGTHGCSA